MAQNQLQMKNNYNLTLPRSVMNPLPIDYPPETDVTPELDDKQANYF